MPSFVFSVDFPCELFGSFAVFGVGFEKTGKITWINERDCRVGDEMFAMIPKWLRSSQLLKPSLGISIPNPADRAQHALGRQKQS